MAGTLQENQYSYFIVSRSVLLRVRSVSVKSCGENQNTHIFVYNYIYMYVFFI